MLPGALVMASVMLLVTTIAWPVSPLLSLRSDVDVLQTCRQSLIRTESVRCAYHVLEERPSIGAAVPSEIGSICGQVLGYRNAARSDSHPHCLLRFFRSIDCRNSSSMGDCSKIRENRWLQKLVLPRRLHDNHIKFYEVDARSAEDRNAARKLVPQP